MTVVTKITEQRKKAAWETISEGRKNTPDWFDLKKSFKDEFYLLVTGSARVNYRNNAFFKDCHYYGIGVTWDEDFQMKRPVVYQGSQSEPAVFEFDEKTKWETINHVFSKEDNKAVEGDVYGISLRRLAQMDLYEGNTDGMKRVERYVTLKDAKQANETIRCYMYVVDTEFFLEYFSYSDQMKLCNTVKYTRPGQPDKFKEAYYAPHIQQK